MFPAGMRTATLQVGPYLDDSGAPRRGSVTVAATTTRVWQPDGTVLAPSPVVVPLDPTGTGRVTLPATDQAGFVDADGAPVSWRYRVVVTLEGADPAERETDLPGGTCDGRVVRVVVVPPPSRDAPPPVTAPSARSPRTDLRLGRRHLLGALALAVPAAALGTHAAAANGAPATATPRAGAGGSPRPSGPLPLRPSGTTTSSSGPRPAPARCGSSPPPRAAPHPAPPTGTPRDACTWSPTSRASGATARPCGSTSSTRARRA